MYVSSRGSPEHRFDSHLGSAAAELVRLQARDEGQEVKFKAAQDLATLSQQLQMAQNERDQELRKLAEAKQARRK